MRNLDLDQLYNGLDFGNVGWQRRRPLNSQNLSARQRSLVARWEEGCPVPEQIINERGDSAARTRSLILSRIGHRMLTEAAHSSSPVSLLDQLLKHTPRLPGENPEPGSFEPNHVPVWYTKEMAFMNTPWGFGGTRIVAETSKTGEPPSLDKLLYGLRESRSPEQMLAVLAERVAFPMRYGIEACGVSPYIVFSQIISPALLREQGCKTMLEGTLNHIEKYAPTLHQAYKHLSPADKKQFKIAL